MKFSDYFPLAGLAIQPDSDSDISVGKTDTWEYFHVSRPFSWEMTGRGTALSAGKTKTRNRNAAIGPHC
jgi:hypothetical protein